MKYKSKKPKPPTGMEMTVTLCMPSGQTVEQSSAALVKFFEVAAAASKEVGSSWIRVNCTGIPEELEGALQAALKRADPGPNLKLIVNNDPSPPFNVNTGSDSVKTAQGSHSPSTLNAETE